MSRQPSSAGTVFRLALALALAGPFVPSCEAAAFRVADLNTTVSGSSFPVLADYRMAVLDGVGYFPADDGIHGNELWRSDGTAAGTWMVRDLCPGLCSSQPMHLSAIGPWLYFGADDGTHGHELWRTDGTSVGFTLVLDVRSGRPSSYPAFMTELGGGILFHASATDDVRTLFRLEEATPTAVVLATGVDEQRPLTPVGGRVVFAASFDSPTGSELWSTDGTLAGTGMLKDIMPGPLGGLFGFTLYPGISSQAVVGGTLFFAADDGVHGAEVWATDGTPAGTVMVADILPGTEGSYASCMVDYGGVLLFSASGAFDDSELWRSDGTPAGTGLVADLEPGSQGSHPCELVRVGPRVVFRATSTTHGTELWATDGSAAGTHLVVDARPGPESAFTHFFASLTGGGDRLLFFADDGVHGMEPWVSDGTAVGTQLLADLAPGGLDVYANSLVYDLRGAWLGSRWIFRTADEVGDVELASSNGTPADTAMLPELNAATTPFSLFFDRSAPFAAIGRSLIFSACDEPLLGAWECETLRTAMDGVAHDLGVDPISLGDNAWYPRALPLSHGGVLGVELGANLQTWRSDGTAAGTALLSSAAPGPATDGPAWLARLGDHGFFVAADRLWRTTGAAGDAEQLFASTGIHQLLPTTSRLFFFVEERLFVTDGVYTPSLVSDLTAPDYHWLGGTASAGDRLYFGRYLDGEWELWTSDGSAAGTIPITAFGSVAGGKLTDLDGSGRYPPQTAAAAGARLVFAAADDATGEEPWVSDGTPAGTQPLVDVRPGAAPSAPSNFVSVGPHVFFVADDGLHGHELWTTDGTAQGTRLVIDLLPGPGSGLGVSSFVPGAILARFGDRVAFRAYTPDHGVEGWVSDGTPEGTFRFTDIAPGPLSSSPLNFTAAGDHLYFAATDHATGYELWAVPTAELASPPTHFHTTAPCRVFDSRATTALGATSRRVDVTGTCGIPATARAVAANVTSVGATGDGHVLARRTFSLESTFELVPVVTGRARAQQVVLQLGFGGVDLSAGGATGVHVIVDVSGWFE
jgi:ELWxxDGT repeat protein